MDTEQTEPMTSVAEMTLAMHDDQITDGGDPERVLANAPERTDDFYVVPKVVYIFENYDQQLPLLTRIMIGASDLIRDYWMAIIAVVVGVVVVLASFGLSLPGKSSDADALNDALKPVYTQETIDGAAQAVAAIEAMGGEMQTAMVPGLAGMLGMTEAEVQGFLGENFPAVAAALGAMPDSLPRFNGVVDTFSANLDNYDTLRPVAFAPIIWTVILGSLIVAIAGGVTLYGRKGSDE